MKPLSGSEKRFLLAIVSEDYRGHFYANEKVFKNGGYRFARRRNQAALSLMQRDFVYVRDGFVYLTDKGKRKADALLWEYDGQAEDDEEPETRPAMSPKRATSLCSACKGNLVERPDLNRLVCYNPKCSKAVAVARADPQAEPIIV